MEPVTVNLTDKKVVRMVTVKFVMEAKDKASLKELKLNDYRLRDAFISLLGNKASTDLVSESDKELLTSEVKDRVDQIVGKGKAVWVGLDNIAIFRP